MTKRLVKAISDGLNQISLSTIARFHRARLERGASMVEWVIIVTLVALAAIAAFSALGTRIAQKVQQIVSSL